MRAKKRTVLMMVLALLFALSACKDNKQKQPKKRPKKVAPTSRRVVKRAVVKRPKPRKPKETVVGKEITYKVGKKSFKGYLAYDSAKQGKRPGVLVVHEWWGHNEYARKRARMLAKLGYVAFALDMYGNGKQANHPKTAGKFASMVMKNLKLAKRRFDAAKAVLLKQPMTDGKKLAAIGYCFGGGVVLQMAREGENLKGVVSFHGSLRTRRRARRGRVKAEILVLNGAADPMTTKRDIKRFKREMKRARVKFKLISYPGAKHAFTNPAATALGKKFKLPLAYDKDADQKSWAEMKAFLARIFK